VDEWMCVVDWGWRGEFDGLGAAVGRFAGEWLAFAVVFAEGFEEDGADAGLDLVPVGGAWGEVGKGCFVGHAFGGDIAFGGGDGFALGSELGARAGAVMGVRFELLPCG
jgi:hypothetical protein